MFIIRVCDGTCQGAVPRLQEALGIPVTVKMHTNPQGKRVWRTLSRVFMQNAHKSALRYLRVNSNDSSGKLLKIIAAAVALC